MQGSTWPTAADSFGGINEGTTGFSAALLMELALAAEAVQLGIGANPYDLRTSHGYANSFNTVGEAVLRRCRIEVGSGTFGAGNTSVAVSFAHARFTSTPIVVLQRFGGTPPDTDQCYEVGNRTTSGFTAYRHDATAAENVRYLAIQVPS
jgi:hypothetical protein